MQQVTVGARSAAPLPYAARAVNPAHADLPRSGRMSHEEPSESGANWLPAPEGQFALIVRACVPDQALIDGSYKLLNVEKH